MSDTDIQSSTVLDRLIDEIRKFADDREWQQFHTPRNLCLALTGEVGELASELQWLTDDQAQEAREPGELRNRVKPEVADVAIYLLRLCDVLDIDLQEAIQWKLAANAQRYTVRASRGNASKQ